MKLFEPGRIGKLSIKNRIVMAAMGMRGGLIEPDGRLSQRGIDYYVARAKGGTGLIITGATRVSRETEYLPGVPRPMADGTMYVNSFSELADAVRWGRLPERALPAARSRVARSLICAV